MELDVKIYTPSPHIKKVKIEMKKELPNGWVYKPYDGFTNFSVKSFDEHYINEKYGVSIIETTSNHRNNTNKVIRRKIQFTIDGVEKSKQYEFEISNKIPIEDLLENYENLLRKVYYRGFSDELLNKI